MSNEAIAGMLGCTADQVKALRLRNAATLREMAAKAVKTGKPVNGFTVSQLGANAEKAEQSAK